MPPEKDAQTTPPGDEGKEENQDAGNGKPDPDAAILAQADNPDAVKAALEREREAKREATEAMRQAQAKVKEFEDRDKSDQQRAADTAAEAEKRAVSAEARALRYEAAAEAGLPLKFATRLVGDDRDALVDDAKALKEELGGGSEPPPDFEGGARPGSSTDAQSMDARIRAAARR